MVDISAFTDDLEEFKAVGVAFLSLAESTGDSTEEIMVDAGRMTERAAFLAALLVEFNPLTDTPQKLRLRCEEVGRMVLDYAEAIRAANAQGAAPVISRFGVHTAIKVPGSSH